MDTLQVHDSFNPAIALRGQTLRHSVCGGTGQPFADPNGTVVCPCCSRPVRADANAGVA